MDCPISQILAVMLAAAPVQAQDGAGTIALRPAEPSMTQRALTQGADPRRSAPLAVLKRKNRGEGHFVEIAAAQPGPH